MVEPSAARSRIAALDLAALTSRLVQTPSFPGTPRQEEAVAELLRRWLAAHGIASELREVEPGRPNLIARVDSGRTGRALLLCGHTDTVALNVERPGVAFSGAIQAGFVQGRGACDMKGALAAMAGALVLLAEEGALPAGSVTFAAVIDEERQSLGAEALIRAGVNVDGAIIGEPTGNRVALGHKGLEWLEIEFIGRAAHGGTASAGINAIEAAARFVVLLETQLRPVLALRRHPWLGPPTINCGTIRGGDQPSTVAAHCTLVVDRRLVPGESFSSVGAELQQLLAEVQQQLPGLVTRWHRQPGGMATLDHGPLLLEAEHPLARATIAAHRAVTSCEESAIAFPAWTDGALLAQHAGIATLVLGPGDLAVAHGPEEAVSIAEVEQAAAIYVETAQRFCAAG